MNKIDQPISVKVRDRVTFDTDEGIQAGYVNGLRRDLGNGELHAWIELDHQWPGIFHAVPVTDILTFDRVGPPSAMHYGIESPQNANEFKRIYLRNMTAIGKRTGEGER